MKLNRNKLRKLLLQESRQIMSEMSMGMGAAPEPDSDAYRDTAQIIQKVVMSCLSRGMCDPMQVNMMCQEMCTNYGCSQFASYCSQRVMAMCQQMGL